MHLPLEKLHPLRRCVSLEADEIKWINDVTDRMNLGYMQVGQEFHVETSSLKRIELRTL